MTSCYAWIFMVISDKVTATLGIQYQTDQPGVADNKELCMVTVAVGRMVMAARPGWRASTRECHRTKPTAPGKDVFY